MQSNIVMQDIGAVAKAWEDSPYLFIVKVQPLYRGVDEDDIGAELLNFAFTSKRLCVFSNPLDDLMFTQ